MIEKSVFEKKINQGKEKGQGYTFEGEYVNGRKLKGILKWVQGSEDYEYQGSFNEEFQF